MTKLYVFLNGQQLEPFELQDGGDYSIGRGADCDVVLQAHKGVSRKHLRIFQENGTWLCENLSRYKNLFVANEIKDRFEISDGIRFSVPPYEFQVVEEKAQVPQEPAAEVQPEQALAPIEQPTQKAEPEVEGNMEATRVDSFQGVAYLKIIHTENGQREVFRLDGNLWVIGREEDADVMIASAKVSRKHFEISRINDEFYIVELGSANGTEVNGKKVVKGQPVQIRSGDKISILTLEMTFEIHDPRFEKQLAIANPANPNIPMPFDHHPGPRQPAVMKMEPEAGGRKNFVRMITIAIASFAVIYGLFGGGDGNKNSATQASNSEQAKVLSPDEKAIVRDAYNLAKSHMSATKYELCLTELAKVHERVPFYENSKELETVCKNARELAEIEAEKQRLNRHQAEIEEQIEQVASECRAKLDQFKTVADLETCLGPGLELSPAHPAFEDLKTTLRIREEEAQVKRQRQASRQRRTTAGKSKYNQAKRLADRGQLYKSVRKYNEFLRGDYPGLNPLRSKAKRELASVRKRLGQKVDRLVSQCGQFNQQGKYKEALLSCDKAIKENPKQSEARRLRQLALSNLRKEMKSIYEDAILEESLGNVDAAKVKWQQIIQENIKNEEYYNKAKIKLRKYGVGI